MSVLIKGMEMPPSCRKCCFCDFGKVGYWCDRLEKTLSKWCVRTQRDAECPLEEVPPHGRLIDADEIEYENWYLEETGESYKMVGKDDIDGMSAIIEAEGIDS